MNERRRKEERKVSVLGNSKIWLGEAKYLKCREVMGEAGRMAYGKLFGSQFCWFMNDRETEQSSA